MSSLSFFRAPAHMSVAAAAAETGAHLAEDADPSRRIRAVAPLERAERDEVSAFFDGLCAEDLLETRAGSCLVAPRDLHLVPRGTCALVTDQPRLALRHLAALLHPASLRPGSIVEATGIDASVLVPASASLESGVTIDPGTIVGPEVEIGAGTFIGAGSVIGAGVRIGRGCAIDAAVTIAHALLGDRVIIHAGARLGHADDDPSRSRGQPSLGRLIVQNDVIVGANATIARGDFSDTVIGEGARLGPHSSVRAGTTVPRGAHVR